MQNSIYKIKYLLFLSSDWEAWCLTVWGVIPPLWKKYFHCLGAPNNLIRHWLLPDMPFTDIHPNDFRLAYFGYFYEKHRSIFFRILIIRSVGKMYCRLSERCSCTPLVDVRTSTVITAKQGRAIKGVASNMATNTVRVNSVLPNNSADCCAGMLGVRQN